GGAWGLPPLCAISAADWSVRSVFRTPSLPQGGPQVLGAMSASPPIAERSIYFRYIKLAIQNGVFCWVFGKAFSRGFFVLRVAHRSKRHTHSLRPIRLTLTAPIDFSARRCERMRQRDGLPPELTISGLSHSASLEVVTSPSWAAKQNRQPR